MPLVLTNLAAAGLLEAALGKSVAPGLTLRLYANDVVPTRTTVRSELTEVSGSHGYAPVDLVAGDWAVAAANPALATYPQVTFTFTGAEGNVYGYYLTGSDGLLKWAERFPDGPYPILHVDDLIRVTPRFTL